MNEMQSRAKDLVEPVEVAARHENTLSTAVRALVTD